MKRLFGVSRKENFRARRERWQAIVEDRADTYDYSGLGARRDILEKRSVLAFACYKIEAIRSALSIDARGCSFQSGLVVVKRHIASSRM
jgi:hypothetical protein